MEKTTKKYSQLDDLQKLKITKVFMYQNLDKAKKKDCSIIFEGTKMQYLIVENQMIDL
jgi:hypothetical protein